VTLIGGYAFQGCCSLTNVSLSPAVPMLEDCFTDCTALISAAADQNMSTVEDLLHSRWLRIRERVTVLLCLKEIWDQMDGVEAPVLRVTEAREKVPKVLWREILEYL
jgi:hypothetical protein